MVAVDTGFIYSDGHVILRDNVANLHMQTKTMGAISSLAPLPNSLA
jgi:hypothetical protein